MAKLKILMVVHNQTEKGTYWRAFQFAKHLSLLGNQVSLISTSPSSHLTLTERKTDGISLIEAPDFFSGKLRSGWDPWATIRRIMWVNKKKFDIIHSFESRPVVIYPALKAKEYGAILIMDWCDFFGKGGSVEVRTNVLIKTFLRPFETYYENHFRKFANGTTVVNSFLKQKSESLGVNPNTIKIVYNGCDTKIKLLDKKTARDLLGFSLDVPLIGFSGGLHEGDARFMARAINNLQNHLNSKIILAGKFNRCIEKYIGNPNAVIRTGSIANDKLFLILSACDVCWLPLQDNDTNRGRLPMKLNNYMSVGRPTISTNVGDLEKLIKENKLGIVTPCNPDLFAEETINLLLDPQKLEYFGNSARHAAETVFNWETTTSDLYSFYKIFL